MSLIKNKGQASLVMVLLIGLVAISSALASGNLSVRNVSVEDTVNSADQAWYAAWAGVDEMMLRLRARQNFGSSYSLSLTLPNNATASAVITGDNNQKTVKATGYALGIIKNLEIKVASSSSKASFIFAAQAGTGGFEMENTSQVTGSSNTDGNVYSNGNVLGTSSSSGSNGAKIQGGVWATGYIGGLNSPTTGGVYIKKNAWASSLTACYVGGNIKAPVPPSNCPRGGTYTITDPPPAINLVSIDVAYWKNQAANGGIWTGNCLIGSGGPTDCTNGTGSLGGIEIIGNLIANNGETIKLTGPVYVKGNLVFSNNVIVNPANGLGLSSAVMVVSDLDNPDVNGKIEMSNNVVFNRNLAGAGVIMISENTGLDCRNPAISLSNNATSVVLIALSGCVYVQENAVVNGVIGKKIHLTQNSSINYDPSLAKAIVDPGSGGWAVVSIKEY